MNSEDFDCVICRGIDSIQIAPLTDLSPQQETYTKQPVRSPGLVAINETISPIWIFLQLAGLARDEQPE